MRLPSVRYHDSFAATSRSLAALAALVLGACTSLTESNPTANRYGSINVAAHNAAGGRASATATAIFFEAYAASVPNSLLSQTDQCVYSSIDTSTSPISGALKAGATVSIAVSGSTLAMPYDSTLHRYATSTTTPFGYGVGDALQVTIPGDPAVYPASTISVRSAEPLVPGVITVPTGTTPMNFSWNLPLSGDTTSAIILSLRYANPSTSATANEQIFCALKDDGVHALPTSALAAFLASPNDKRSLVMTRWRTRELSLDTRTILHIATSVDTTLTFKP